MRNAALIILFLCTAMCYAPLRAIAAGPQQQRTETAEKMFVQTLRSVRAARKALEDAKPAATPNAAALDDAMFRMKRAVDEDLLEWARYLVGTEAVQSFLSEVEQQRIDKQVGSGADSSGSTSLVTKGSAPRLLGFAVENGAVTRETNGTTITFRVNPTGFVKALVERDFLTSGPTNVFTNIPESDTWVRILSKSSFYASFDTSKGPNAGMFTAERSQLTGYGGHYDLINDRDPRDKKNQKLWDQLRVEAGTALASALTELASVLNQMVGYSAWADKTKDDLLAASADNVAAKLLEDAEQLRKLVDKEPKVSEVLKTKVLPAANAYAISRVDLLKRISKAPTLSFDYTNTRQSVVLGDGSSGKITLPAGIINGLPNLGNFLLTASGKFIGESEVTANFSATRFNGRRPSPSVGRWRNIQAGFQVDVPLPKIQEIGKPVLSFSYLYLNLLEEPLGAKILVNGVEESRKGTINFGQAKMDFPIGSTGMHIPISFTFSNRTELIKEKNMRGNIGITFDLDKLFSKKQ